MPVVEEGLEAPGREVTCSWPTVNEGWGRHFFLRIRVSYEMFLLCSNNLKWLAICKPRDFLIAC